MPVRRVSNRGGNIIGSFPSIKMGRMVAFESLLERDYLYLLDYDPDVERFEEQPLTIEYRHDGKMLHYTPDFRLIERGCDVLVECKPDKFSNTDENRRKFAAARDWCTQHNWEFRVVTDRQIRAGFRLQNVKLLTRYARQTVAPAIQGRIYALLCDSQTQLTINDIARTVSPHASGIVTASILHMAFHYKVFIPLNNVPISGDTPVCLPSQIRKESRT